jgi:hypothetical protein
MQVTVQRFLAADRLVVQYPYEVELDRLGEEVPKIRDMTDHTRRKVITVYLRMLREARLMRGDELQQPVVSNLLWMYFVDLNARWFITACFIRKAQLS